MNIVLIGFMGTGKTSVGKVLAQRLKWQFYDTDDVIEKQVGIKISDIFARHGEVYFRDLETKTINLLSLLDKAVIACGGGVVLKKENMEALERNGIIVCLEASPQKIFERTKSNSDRPLLNVKNPLDRICEILQQRKKLYERCSISINTDDLTIEQVVDKILNNSIIKKNIDFN